MLYNPSIHMPYVYIKSRIDMSLTYNRLLILTHNKNSDHLYKDGNAA